MDATTRKRIKLEKLMRMQKRKNAEDENAKEGTILQALNILNLNSSCCFFLRQHSPALYSSISSLKEKATFMKRKFDELCLDDYSIIAHTSLYSYNRIMEEIPEKMVYDTPKKFAKYRQRKKKGSEKFSEEIQNQNKNLVKHMSMKLEFLFEENPLNYYITHIIRDFKQQKWRISEDAAVAETQIKKFLRVCDFFPPKFEISSSDSVSQKHYSLFENLLKFCHALDLKDSEMVMKVCKVLLKMHPVNPEILPPTFTKELLRYILFHDCKTKTNLQYYISNYYNTIWSFSRNLSVLESVAAGDEDFVFQLLKAGLEIFPEEEQEEIDHKFPNISTEVMPKTHKMILFVMGKIVLNSLCNADEDISVNENQKKCFREICRYIMTTYVSKKELYTSISAEYDHLLSNGINEDLCQNRKRRLRRQAKLYADNFPEMSKNAKEPRSLQDLCLLSLRKSFRHVHNHTTAAPSIVRDMHRVFNLIEEEEFRQPFEN